MPKFGTGVRVRITNTSLWDDSTPQLPRPRNGDTGTIMYSRYTSPGWQCVTVDGKNEPGNGWYFKERWLEVIPDTPDRMVFEGGGMREPQDGKPRFDLLFPEGVPYDEQFLTRFAVHMAKGAAKYEDRNWEKFSDKEALERAKASALRHIMQWLSGETDEDHAAAVVFNLMAAEHVKRKLENAGQSD